MRWWARTVHLIVVLHEEERISVDVAVEFDVWSGMHMSAPLTSKLRGSRCMSSARKEGSVAREGIALGKESKRTRHANTTDTAAPAGA
jgi:hypothetical protein